MEGEESAAKDKGQQTLPPDPGELNGESDAPSKDLKETVEANDDGSASVMVNGENDEEDAIHNVSLDTQTQTKEDEFPAEDGEEDGKAGEEEAQPKQEGVVSNGVEVVAVVERVDEVEAVRDEGESPEAGTLEDECKQEKDEVLVDDSPEDGIPEETVQVDDIPVCATPEADASHELPEAVDEREESSEGYGSQDADKTLESAEPTPEEKTIDEEKEEAPESQDEGLASPESVERKVVSTHDSIQAVGSHTTNGNIDNDVDLLNEKHALEFDPILAIGNTCTSQVGLEDTEQTQGTLEPYTEHKQMNGIQENRETNILFDNTDQTYTGHDSEIYMQNMLIGEEGQGETVIVAGYKTETIPVEHNKLITDTDMADQGTGKETKSQQVEEGRKVDFNQKKSEGNECNTMEAGLELDLQLQKEDVPFPEVSVDADKEPLEETPTDPTVDLVVGYTTFSQLDEESLKVQGEKEEHLEIDQGSGNSENQAEIFTECDKHLEESRSLYFDKELDSENTEERKVNGEGEIFDLQKPLNENVVNFVDGVVNKALEKLSYSKKLGSSKESLVLVDVILNDAPEDDSTLVVNFSETTNLKKPLDENVDEVVVNAFEKMSNPENDSKLGIIEENPVLANVILNDAPEDNSSLVVNFSETTSLEENEKEILLDEDLSNDAQMDSNGNIEVKFDLKKESSLDLQLKDTTEKEVFVSTPEELSPQKYLSPDQETRTQRWSVPSGQFTAGGFTYAQPNKDESTSTFNSQASSASEGRKFRPVRFRPTSQLSSKEARLRRTSLGVPRGWNAPPIDLLGPPPSETAPESFEPPTKSLDDIGPSSLASDISSESSVSLPSIGSSKAREEENIYRAEPVMIQAEENTVQSSALPSSDSGISVLLVADFDSGVERPNVEIPSARFKMPEISRSSLTSTSSSESSSIKDPISPVTKNFQQDNVRRTPPLNQKVEVYEIKEEPILSPTLSSKRATFGQNRSATTGQLTVKKISKAEEERQQVLAALRIKRPVKSKWQGQIELEEREKEKQYVLGGKSLESLQKYQKRKQRQVKPIDLRVSGELTEVSVDLGDGDDSSSRASEKEEGGNRLVEPSGDRHRPRSLNIDSDPEGMMRAELDIPREELLSPNGDTCSSGYTSGRSTPAGEDATRLLSLPKTGGPGESSLHKDHHTLEETEEQGLFSNDETGLRRVTQPDPVPEPVNDAVQEKSYVQSAVKLREKKGNTRVNSHVVKQHRISFVEQEVLRQKQQEEEFQREREMRSQELHQAKTTSPPQSQASSTSNSRLQSPTSPEPPPVKPKAPRKQSNSKAKAVYQELKYNPKTGGGNRSSAMVRDWESKFNK